MPSNTFYAAAEEPSSDEDEEELVKRKRAWAELEREQDEVKRNIKSILKTQPESRLIGEGAGISGAERVKVPPVKHDYEERIAKEDKKSQKLKDEVRREERPAQPSGNGRPSSAANAAAAVESSASIGSSMPA